MECQTVSSASRFGSDRNVTSYSLFSLVGRKRDFTKLKFPRDQMVKTAAPTESLPMMGGLKQSRG